MRNLIWLFCWPLLVVDAGYSTPQLINRITFEGNHTIPSDNIQRVMILKEGSEYDPFLFEKDIENILELYRDKGFPNAEIVQKRIRPVDGHVDCQFVIREGERIKLTSVELIGNEALSTTDILASLGFGVGSPFDPDIASAGRYQIKSLYYGRGYIYADVKSNVIRDDTSTAVIFAIQEGLRVRIGQIRFEGNSLTRKAIMERELVIKPGDVYDPKKIYESQGRLYALNLFRDVDFEISGVRDSSETVDLVFRVEEVSPRWASLGGGFQSPDRILANLKAGHDNFLGNGQQLSISTFFSYNLKKEHEEEIELEYVEPYFVSTPFRLMLRIFHNRERWLSYSQQETGTNVRVGRYITENLKFFVQYQYKGVYIDTLQGSVEGITNSILFALSRDTRDNIFNPLRGTYTSLSLETAGGILGGSNHFGRSILDFSSFINPARKSVLGFRAQFGEISPFGVSEEGGISLNERFELGGAASMRGYDYASIGPIDARQKQSGYVLINSNVELRFPFYRKLWMGLFIDSGGIWMERGEIAPSDLKFSCGLGFRYSLPMGPLRLDYARRLTDSTPGELGRLYVAIGHMF